MESTGTDANDRGPPGRKSVLFCSNCGHHSHVHGDWVLHERRGSGSVWYQCPECSRAVSVRPARTLEDARLPSPMSAGTSSGSYGMAPVEVQKSELWEDLWDTYRTVTTAWLRPWQNAPAERIDSR